MYKCSYLKQSCTKWDIFCVFVRTRFEIRKRKKRWNIIIYQVLYCKYVQLLCNKVNKIRCLRRYNLSKYTQVNIYKINWMFIKSTNPKITDYFVSIRSNEQIALNQYRFTNVTHRRYWMFENKYIVKLKSMVK